MLRASIEYSGADGGLDGISEGAKAGDAGIAHGELLTAFAELHQCITQLVDGTQHHAGWHLLCELPPLGNDLCALVHHLFEVR